MTCENARKMKADLRTFLSDKLPHYKLLLVHKSYDIVGDIAIIRIPESLQEHAKIIADAVMALHKNVKAVWQQASPVSGEHRLRELKWVRGRRKATTIHKEHGCVFKVDLRKCYFSPRLSYERLRLAKLVEPNEVVVNMFAGVGCFSIVMAKHSKAKRIYSIDINPMAVECMQENIRLNRVDVQVFPVLGDSEKVGEKKLQRVADRVLMPLPEKAYEYLNSALATLKPNGGFIHYYDFEHARKGENPVDKVKEKVLQKLNGLRVPCRIDFGRIIRATGPNWYQVVLDITIEKQI